MQRRRADVRDGNRKAAQPCLRPRRAAARRKLTRSVRRGGVKTACGPMAL